MPIIEIEMLISRNTSQGTKSKGDVVRLPQREANSFIARGQAKLIDSIEPEEIEPDEGIEESE